MGLRRGRFGGTDRSMRSALLRLASLLAFVAALLPAAPAYANDVFVEAIAKALQGQTQPGLILHAHKAIASAHVRLRGPDGKTANLHSGAIGAGDKRELYFDAPLGRSRWTGELEVRFVDGTSGTMPLSFEVLVSAGVSIRPPERSDLDAKAGTLRLVLDGGNADKCQYEVNFDGKPPRRGWTRMAGEAPGTPITVSWPPHGEDDIILRLQVVCHDREGFYSPTLEIFPWEAPIAHDDVVFETGKSDILPSERPKLDAAYERIAEGIRRYGRVLEDRINLYIAGHTDTVGGKEANRDLSLRRARSIARYFREKGVRVTIYYTGFGEDRLLVPTPDETDEPRNRRAEYIIAVDPPVRAKWTRL